MDFFLLLKKNILSDRGDEEGVNDRETPVQEDFTMTGHTTSFTGTGVQRGAFSIKHICYNIKGLCVVVWVEG